MANGDKKVETKGTGGWLDKILPLICEHKDFSMLPPAMQADCKNLSENLADMRSGKSLTATHLNIVNHCAHVLGLGNELKKVRTVKHED